MNRSTSSILSSAIFASIFITASSFAADKPTSQDKTKPNTIDSSKTIQTITPNKLTPSKPSTPAAPAIPADETPSTTPTVVSAQFTDAEVRALEFAPFKLDGINIGAGMDCFGVVSWGDGTQYDGKLGANGQWQTLKQKSYTKAGKYKVVVTPKKQNSINCITNRPSNSPITIDVTVAPPTPLPPSTIAELSVSSGRTRNANERTITIKWDNGGQAKAACNFIVYFGDGAVSPEMTLWTQKNSVTLTHKYAATDGAYSVIVSPTQSDYDSCSVGPNAGPKTFTL